MVVFHFDLKIIFAALEIYLVAAKNIARGVCVKQNVVVGGAVKRSHHKIPAVIVACSKLIHVFVNGFTNGDLARLLHGNV